MKRCIGAALFLTALAGLGACAHAETNAGVAPPQTASGYPDLRSVPETHRANTNQQHWDAVTSDLLAAADAMKSNERADFGVLPEDPAIFLDEAREDLTETRDSH